VRFGNVLDSAGSVVPLFREQIRKGRAGDGHRPGGHPLLHDHPEACQLILQAAASAPTQAIYTLDMGEPVPIRYWPSR
jgi:FlaA1/EpsC-like NDP-sugar epimerase